VAISYCSIEDVLLNHARIPDTPDERTAITMFIEIAEGKINDKLRGKYEVPFSVPIPATIRGICMDLTTYYELRRLAGANTGITQEWIDQYKSASLSTQMTLLAKHSLHPTLTVNRRYSIWVIVILRIIMRRMTTKGMVSHKGAT
jgi:hypothetical protein